MIKAKEMKETREADAYRFLEREFEGTFIEELIPGILHNFANPLNGIIGRTRLLQRRLEEAIRKTREAYPDAERALGEDHAKLLKDIELITQPMTRDVYSEGTDPRAGRGRHRGGLLGHPGQGRGPTHPPAAGRPHA